MAHTPTTVRNPAVHTASKAAPSGAHAADVAGIGSARGPSVAGQPPSSKRGAAAPASALPSAANNENGTRNFTEAAHQSQYRDAAPSRRNATASAAIASAARVDCQR